MPMNSDDERDLGELASQACLWEVAARKAGNVHPQRSFADVSHADFVVSAAVIYPVFRDSAIYTVGGLVLDAIRLTRRVVHTNTNLGIVLLLAPLALSRADRALRLAVIEVLDGLTVTDSEQVYEAIRLAQPGGMGEVATQDIAAPPTLPLRQVMALARDRDMIARQYANGFQEVLHEGVPSLKRGMHNWGNLEDAIVGTHLEFMASYPDTLIARKCGLAEAEESSRRARAVLDAGWPLAAAGLQGFAAFDAWLRADGNRRNPGTSADLVTACISAALRDNKIGLPLSIPWSRS
jgi:triphosphoribosyl-dephospho-CoA synthase